MQAVGGYEIAGKIGTGGMATVYKGRQVSLDRPVAIKVLATSLRGQQDLRERFERESLIIARLAHPNIIHVIDRGITRRGMPYFVMEYVQGRDLAAAIRAGDLDLNRKLDLMIQVCKALAYAHKNGVVHRDVKPGNVLIDGDGNARVLDFGIAQFAEEHAAERTQVGTVMGTLAYMSPEQQLAANAVTPASDLYSLGALMYELFTGQKPLGRFPPPRTLDEALHTDLDALILQCLEPRPADRPRSADEIKERLLMLLRGAHLDQDQRQRAHQGMSNSADKFGLLDVIKEDAHGAVYLYEDRVNRKLLILKRKRVTSRGLTEAQLLTTLKHPHIVNVMGASRNASHFIIVMEYVSGGSLKDRLIQALPWGEALRILKEMAGALAFAHRNRVVHGNLRPSNVLFTESGQVRLTDFGLDEHYARDASLSNWYGVRGEALGPQTDVFAAGVILYQMLTGELPRWAGPRLQPHNAFTQLPEAVQQLTTHLLARAPEQRPAGFDPVARAVDAILGRYAAAMGPGSASADDPTVVAMDASQSGAADAPPVAPARSTRTSRILLWSMALLLGTLLLCGGAFAYLVHVGAVQFSDAVLGELWNDLRGLVSALGKSP